MSKSKKSMPGPGFSGQVPAQNQPQISVSSSSRGTSPETVRVQDQGPLQVPGNPPGAVISVSQLHTGPLPSASEMKQYADVYSDLPQHIVQMAELEQKHRFAQDENERVFRNEELRVNFRLTCCGICASVVCVLVIMTAAVLCALLHHPITAGCIGSGGIVMIVVVLVCGSRLQHNGSSQKR